MISDWAHKHQKELVKRIILRDEIKKVLCNEAGISEADNDFANKQIDRIITLYEETLIGLDNKYSAGYYCILEKDVKNLYTKIEDSK